MGKGNVGVAGAYEGLFYIDNEDFHVYRRNDDLDDWPETRLMRDLDYAELTGDGWLFDEEGTANEEDCALPGFVDSKNEEKTERNAGYLLSLIHI